MSTNNHTVAVVALVGAVVAMVHGGPFGVGAFIAFMMFACAVETFTVR